MKCPKCGYEKEEHELDRKKRELIERVVSLGAQQKYKELKKFNKKNFRPFWENLK